MPESSDVVARGSGDGVVQSVARALFLLEAVARTDEAPLSQITRETGLTPSTAHRLLATLIACGYVMQSAESGRYRLTHKVVAIAGDAEARQARLRSGARPHLDAVRQATGETVNLVILEGFSATYVDQVEGSAAVRMFTQIGRRVPAHATGAGKALLAFQPEASLEPLFAAEPFAGLTPMTITRAAELREELAGARDRGYATDIEEYESGVGCVAAPVLGSDGRAVAAISVSAPLARLQALDVAKVGAALAGRTAELARELGV